VYDVGHVGDQPFIVMEHVEGMVLNALIPPGTGLGAATALHYARQIIDAVAHAHGRGIVHRDLKSSNIMIAPDGRVKLLDFGLAVRLPETDPSELGTTSPEAIQSDAGTVPYMAPELLRGRRADRRSDVWALGVLLYEIIAGRRPFTGATRYELAAAILTQSPAPLPHKGPAALRPLVARSLLKNPGDRYQSATALATALDDALLSGSACAPTA
jgi:serine/threonine protein kinase